MADLKTTNIYGDAYINNKVGINTNTPATRLQIGQLSPTAATEGIQFGDDTGARMYRSAASTISIAGNFNASSGTITSTYGGFSSPGLILGDAQYGFYVASGNLYYKSAAGGNHYWRNIANNATTLALDNSGNLTAAGALSATSLTTTVDGTNITMAGTANAEGIRMTAASSTTYPVFLKSINPGSGGESSPWIYRENSPDWGIWHNNPLNTIDFTKQGSGGIANNVGGSSSNTVMVRVDMANGTVQTSAGYLNKAGTTILSDSGNITGNAATATTANALNSSNSYTVYSLTATSELGTRGTDIGANIERGSSALSTLRFDSDAFRFYAGGTGGIGEVLRVTEGGNLTVKGTDNNNGKSDFTVDVGGGSATMAFTGRYFRVGDTDVNWSMKMQANGYLATYAQQFDIATVAGAYAMTFATDNIERMRISGTGLVGIGTTNPSSLLHLYISDSRYLTFNSTGLLTLQRNVLSTNAVTPQLTIINTQGSDAGTGRGVGIQLDLGYGGSSTAVGTAARGARIAALNETNYDATAANQNASLVFFTSIAGSLTEKVRITSGGFIGIGTTTPSASLHAVSTTSGATLLRTDGTNGTLFSVVDDLSDSLMSVNNSAGLPVLEVFADDRVIAGQYGQNDFVVRNNYVGIGTNNPTAKLYVTSSTSTPSALFLGGNVGIGTTNPVYRLQVSGQTFLNNGTSNALQIQTVVADTTTRDAIYLYEDSGAATGRQAISWYNGNQSYYKARLWTEVGNNYQATQFGIDVADDARTVATRLLIRNGNVGIGTTLPQALLHVNGVISGSSFTGAGTGLTGTAAGLSIGGSAGSATSATSATYISSLGANLNYEPYSGSRATLFKTSGLSHYTGYSTGTNRPTTYDYTLQVGNGSAGWEISMDWISLSGPAIFARSVRDCCQGWSQWVRILDSVNYAYAANMNQNVRTSDNVTFGTVTASLNGNCTGTATSAATWTTGRAFTIGSIAKTVDGSSAITWSLAEIGAAATNQTMYIGTTAVAINRASANLALTGITSIDGNAATATTANALNASNQYSVTGITGSIQTTAVRETFSAISSATTGAIDLSTATVFNLAFSSSISVFSISNVNTSKVNSFTLISAGSGTAATITWNFITNGGPSTAVKWVGTAPTATTTANRWDIFSFVYNGTNWYGFTGGLNYV